MPLNDVKFSATASFRPGEGGPRRLSVRCARGLLTVEDGGARRQLRLADLGGRGWAALERRLAAGKGLVIRAGGKRFTASLAERGGRHAIEVAGLGRIDVDLDGARGDESGPTAMVAPVVVVGIVGIAVVGIVAIVAVVAMDKTAEVAVDAEDGEVSVSAGGEPGSGGGGGGEGGGGQ